MQEKTKVKGVGVKPQGGIDMQREKGQGGQRPAQKKMPGVFKN